MLTTVVCATGLAALAHLALPMIRSDWISAPVYARQDLWEREEASWTVEDWEDAELRLQTSLRLTPNNPVLMDALARLYALRGTAEWTTGHPGSPELAWFERALEMQKRSIGVRPQMAMSWANRAIYESALSLPAETWSSSWNQALKLGPNEIIIRRILMDLALRNWDESPASIKQWAQEHDTHIQEHLNQRAVAAQNAASAAEQAASAPE